LSPAFDPGTGATQLDVIASAIGQLAASGFVADGVVLSAADATKTRLLKSTAGEFLSSSPDSTIGMTAMWNIPVVISPSLGSGTWLVAAFQQSCVLFSRQLLTVEISYQDQDNFVRNLAALKNASVSACRCREG
jgi:hypothetical protein